VVGTIAAIFVVNTGVQFGKLHDHPTFSCSAASSVSNSLIASG
jgi:hypothetical protein